MVCVEYGMVGYGMLGRAFASAREPTSCSMVWYGMVWYGMVWYGMVWYGMAWYGMVWYGMVTVSRTLMEYRMRQLQGDSSVDLWVVTDGTHPGAAVQCIAGMQGSMVGTFP